MRLLLVAVSIAATFSLPECFFPESEIRPFFFEVSSSSPVGTVIADSIVDPPDAVMKLASVRANNLAGKNFTNRFELRTSRANGRFQLVAVEPLSLPALPSTLQETTLFVTVFCNERPFPLISVQITADNSVAPVFLGTPYQVQFNETVAPGQLVPLPILALDWDPTPYYNVSLSIENNSDFELVPTGRQKPKEIEDIAKWKKEQLPRSYSLRKLTELPVPDSLKIIASDGVHNTSTTLRLLKESSSIPKGNEVVAQVEEASTTVRPRAFHSKIVEQRPIGAASFIKCYTAVNLQENSPGGTPVIRMEVEGGDQSTRLRLVDPDGTFTMDERTGEVTVADSNLVDREHFSTLEFVAEIENASRLSLCPRARVRVHILDENDNRPVFEHENYVFLLSALAPINTEVAVLKARDIDDAENGYVRYSLVNGSTTPFRLFFRNRDAYLTTVAPIDADVDSYELVVEAKDNGIPEKSTLANVSVRIVDKPKRLHPEPIRKNVVDHDQEEVIRKKQQLEEERQKLRDEAERKEKTEEKQREEERRKLQEELEERRRLQEEEDRRKHRRYEEEKKKRKEDEEKEQIRRQEEEERTLRIRQEAERYIKEKEEEQRRKAEKVELLEKKRKETAAVRGVVSAHDRTPVRIDDTSREFFRRTNFAKQKPGTTTTEQPEEYEEDVDGIAEESQSIEEEVTPRILRTEEGKAFAFTAKHYTFDVFGQPPEDVIFGGVLAEPNPQMYAIDRKVLNMFKVDADVGELSVGRNPAPRGNFTFKVSATDGMHTAHATVTVQVEPRLQTTDALPRFDQRNYRFIVDELRTPRVVGIVRAYHAAIHPEDNPILYDLISEEADLPFSVNELSGEVATERVLEADQRDNYDFEVRACLTTPSSQCSSVPVEVTLRGSRRTNLRFEKDLYDVGLHSDLVVGAEIANVRAPGATSYRLLKPSSTFSVNPVTGAIKTISPLTESHYDLLVEAEGGQKSATAQLKIEVIGTNPSSPAFDQKRYDVVLQAPIRVGSVVAEVRATDPDPGPEGTVRYRILDGADGFFEINERTGMVSALRNIGTQDGSFDITIEATDSGTIIKRHSTTLLHVDIVGGAALQYIPLPSTIFISSEKAVGSVVLRASATSSSPVHFRVVPESSPFFMDEDLLRVAAHLQPGRSNLIIRAENDQTSVDHHLEVVVMSDRDKYPVFSDLTYDFDIPLDEVFPIVIHRFNAKVSNGSILYNFYPRNGPKGLILDPITGDLTVSKEFVANSITNTVFIVIRATNIQYPKFFSDVGVALNVVARRATLRFPQSLYRFEIEENSAKGLQLGLVEAFPRQSSLQYSIQPSGVLGVHPNGSVFLEIEPDLESLPVDRTGKLEFIITARSGHEKASTKLQLQLSDENEFAPEFSHRMVDAHISEDASPGATIAKLQAFDKDFSEGQHLLYRVIGGSGRDFVFIQEDGTLILGDKPLDREQISEFDVEVEVYDRLGSKDRALVHVIVDDINDNAPVFSQDTYEWTVKEDDPDAFFELEVHDNDAGENQKIGMKILKGNERNNFKLENAGRDKARITVISPLNFEESQVHELTIEARDRGTPTRRSTATVNVHVENSNDTPPRLRSAKLTQKTPISLPIGFPVLTVVANDDDGDRLTYKIRECPGFSIDPLGVISFNIPVTKRKEGTLKCFVDVSDGKYLVTANIILEIYNDVQPTVPANRAPVFAQKDYEFVLTGSSIIGKIDVSDPDGENVLLAIQPAEYRKLFNIDDTGKISLKVRPQDLKQPLYSFLVTAEDWGPPIMTSIANVKISNPLRETTKLSTTIRTTEPASTQKQTTTTTTTMTSTTTKRTTTTEATTTERRHDKPVASEDPLALPPVIRPVIKFLRPTYIFSIPDDSPSGTYLGQAQLTYNDGVRLSIDGDGRLTINEAGRIHTNAEFNGGERINQTIVATYEGERVAAVPFLLYVIGKDKTTFPPRPPPSTSSTATRTSPRTSTTPAPAQTDDIASKVVVPGTDASPPTDSRFSFERSMYFAFVPEGAYNNGVKVALKPEELSTTALEPVRYALANTTSNLPFFMEKDGQLLMFNVDREVNQNFMLQALAMRGSEVAKTLINVTILDVNDNYPIFESHPATIGIWSDTNVGDTIYRFKASDLDDGDNGLIRYELGGEASGLFSINPSDGTLTLETQLPPSADEHRLIITARDMGRPSLKTHHQIGVKVFDINRSAPDLPSPTDGVVVPGDSPPGYQILTLLAGPNSEFSQHELTHYRLTDDHQGLFKIEHDGRLVLNREASDSEIGRMYQLNVIAENSAGSDSTVVNMLLESQVAVTPSSQPSSECVFDRRIYEAEITENDSSKRPLLVVHAICDGARYSLEPSSDDFTIDSVTGEIRAVRPLDRERRSMHFLYINAYTSKQRRSRQASIMEEAKERLRDGQALVIVRVLDENDSLPEFLNTVQGRLVAHIDATAKVGKAVLFEGVDQVGRLQATDPDENQHFEFSLAGDDEDDGLFGVDPQTGVVTLQKPLDKTENDVFKLTATVSDGLHVIPIPLEVYKLTAAGSVIRLTSEKPFNQIDERRLKQTLSVFSNADIRLVKKTKAVDDPTHSEIFIFGVDKESKKPLTSEQLMDLLSPHSDALLQSSSQISSMSRVDSDADKTVQGDVVGMLVLICLLCLCLLACIAGLCVLKKRRPVSGHEYIMDSTAAGPRPYDVEKYTRQTAQNVLASRTLPSPGQIEVAVSPAFVDAVTTNRSDSAEHFSNSVRERPSLLQSALSRHRVQPGEAQLTADVNLKS